MCFNDRTKSFHQSPIDSKPKFLDSTIPLLANGHAYRRLVGKLIYLIVTRTDIILGTAHLVVGTLSHGRTKNNTLSLSPVPKLNTVL